MMDPSPRSAIDQAFIRLGVSSREAASWPATERYGVRPAPDGLGLVQDLLNTRASALTGPDMLGDAANADAWAVRAVQAWSTQRGTVSELATLTAHDARKLRHLRDALDRALAGVPDTNALRDLGAAELTITGISELRWAPIGHGWRWCYGAILGEVLLSQHNGTWRRLKQCHNASCRATFYDSAWHNGTVWHNQNTCAPAFTDRVAQPLHTHTEAVSSLTDLRHNRS